MLFIIIFTLLIFPIFLNIDVYYRKDIKKVFFNICIYKRLKVFGGYISIIKDGLLIHYTNKKALLISFKSIFGIKNKVKPLKDYHFININSLIESDYSDNQLNTTVLAFVYVWHNQLIGRILAELKPYLKYKNEIELYEYKKETCLYLETTTIFNLLMIIISLIKMLVEKMLYAVCK